VDVRDPDLSAADGLRTAYEAKARAELGDADAVVGAAPGSWEGELVGARVAFLAAHPAVPGDGGVLATRVKQAAAKAADALGAGDGIFVIATRPVPVCGADDRARRLRFALEAVDPPAVIALDAESAEDLAAAFGIDALRAGTPVRAFGRALGFVGDFEASLDDPAAKARAWSAMKATASLAGLKAKGRPKAPPAKPA
jgi:hypothetical protein